MPVQLFLIFARVIMRRWPLGADLIACMRQSAGPGDRVDERKGTIRPDDTASSRETSSLSFKEQQGNADKALKQPNPPTCERITPPSYVALCQIATL